MESVDFEIMDKDGRIRESGTLRVTEDHRTEKVHLHPDNPAAGLYGEEIFVGVRRIIFEKPLTIQDGETLSFYATPTDASDDRNSGSP